MVKVQDPRLYRSGQPPNSRRRRVNPRSEFADRRVLPRICVKRSISIDDQPWFVISSIAYLSPSRPVHCPLRRRRAMLSMRKPGVPLMMMPPTSALHEPAAQPKLLVNTPACRPKLRSFTRQCREVPHRFDQVIGPNTSARSTFMERWYR